MAEFFKWIGCLALIVALLISGAETGNEPPPRFIGFVELPGIFGTIDPNGPPGQRLPEDPQPIPLHAEPSRGSKVVWEITDKDQVQSREFGYEEHAALAYKVEGDWILVGYTNGSEPQSDWIAPQPESTLQFGWLSPEHAGTFHPFETVIEESLVYLTSSWNQKVYDRPGGDSIAVTLPEQIKQTDVNVLEVRGSGHDSWVRIEVLQHGHCQFDEPEEIITSGWVPIYSQDDSLNFWFYPRGC